MYDAVIIGGGAVGCAVARELSRWKLKICLAEQGEDVCVGTSKANSAIVHAGFDAPTGSMKARFNVEGSRRMEALSRELDFPYRRNGALVVEMIDPQPQTLDGCGRFGLGTYASAIRFTGLTVYRPFYEPTCFSYLHQ